MNHEEDEPGREWVGINLYKSSPMILIVLIPSFSGIPSLLIQRGSDFANQLTSLRVCIPTHIKTSNFTAVRLFFPSSNNKFYMPSTCIKSRILTSHFKFTLSS